MARTEAFASDFHNRSYEISFLNEIWLQENNKGHQNKIETLLQMHSIQFLSNPRKGIKRGGGTAIAWRTNNFHVRKMNISIPRGLEVN